MLIIRSVFVLALTLIALPAVAANVAGAARVVDGDTLRIGGTAVRLFGIDAPERAQGCERGGAVWDCGGWATGELRALVAGGDLSCAGDEVDRYGRLLAVCHVGGAEINAAMVRRGAAFAYRRYSGAYDRQERAAKAEGLGIWAGKAETPEAFRQAQVPVAVQAADTGGCLIKGNISDSGRIYHMPGQRDYADTRISARRGERWFCSAPAAEAAGWRAARR